MLVLLLIVSSLQMPTGCNAHWTLCNDGWITPAPNVYMKCINGKPVTLDYNNPKSGWSLVCEE